MYILSVVKNIFNILEGREKRRYILVQVFFLISAIFQVVGIASIAPFISILSNPEIIHTNSVLSAVYEFGGFTDDLSFIVAAAIGSLVMILLSNAVAALTVWITYQFSVTLGSGLQRAVYKSFLRRNFLFHKTRNYNQMISIVSQQVPRFVYMVFQPFLLLTSQIFIAVIILLGLVFLDPMLAFIAGGLIGGSYLGTYIYLRKSLAVHGEVLTQRNRKIQGILSESFIGIKDIKLGSMEEIYLNRFNKQNSKGLKSQAFIALAGQIPKFVIESISFAALLVLALVLLTTESQVSSVVPILSIYALAGYKLLPTMQDVYKSISSLSGHGSVARVIRDELSSEIDDSQMLGEIRPLPIRDIFMEDVSFSYPGSSVPAVNGVSLKLERGAIYSLAGHSGSGKSTLADLLLGLLQYDSGRTVVNGDVLSAENLSSFRASLNYVGQNIFVLDDTVVNNVAFGVPDQEIDLSRVEKAIDMANATEFVRALPEGMNTRLGQDGKLLSGGQRQRIGIARALYRKSDLLVLDEPTSALDIDSEFRLLQALDRIKRDVIILIISHRPASIKMSDKVIIMREGEIRSVGSYQELMKEDEEFRLMIEKSSI